MKVVVTILLLALTLCSAYNFPGLRKVDGSEGSCAAGASCDELLRPEILIVNMRDLDCIQVTAASLHLWQTLFVPTQNPRLILVQQVINKPCVSLGQSQNPWKETKPLLLKEDGVNLFRRTSGGGTGFVDKDQLVLAFVTGDPALLDSSFQVLVTALQKFGLKAERSGRNDLIVEGKKVSGSTFMSNPTKLLHWINLLVNTSLPLFGKYLTPNRLKLESKGVKSVEARVTTLQALNPAITVASAWDAVLASFLELHAGKSYEIHDFNFEEMLQNPTSKRNYDRLLDPEWTYGETREFTHQISKKFPWSMMEVNIESKGKSMISDVIIYGDAMEVDIIPSLQKNLKGVQYSAEGVAQAMAKAKLEFVDDPAIQAKIDEFGAWLTENL